MVEMRDDVHRTILVVDIAGFSAAQRTRANYVSMRAGMFAAIEHALQETGISWTDCFHESTGDGVFILVPGNISKGVIAERLPQAFVAALMTHNDRHPPDERLRVRLAMHAGEIVHDDHGVTGPAINRTFRLVDAKPLKDALANSSGVLAIVVSEWFYDEVIRHSAPRAPEEYRRIEVSVKETNVAAWIRLPDHVLPEVWPAAATDLTARTGDGRPSEPPVRPVLVILDRPNSELFDELVDVLDVIPCLQNEHARSLVVERLRPAISGAIKYFPQRRMHIVSILRTCMDYDGGVQELVSIISDLEQRSSSLNRLVALLEG
jgi:class 3 adenylate cyclase